jgi:ATP-dependent DNA helicase DinG
VRAAAQLPGEGWSGRIAPASGEINPIGPVEAFLAASWSSSAPQRIGGRGSGELGLECSTRPVLPQVREAARAAAQALGAVEAPLLALAKALEDLLDEEAADLPTGDRARIEGALRGLDRRARMTLPAWRSDAAGAGRRRP